MSQAHPLWLCYCPFPNDTVANRIVYEVVQQHLAACANLLAPCTSIYEWDDELHREEEIPVLFKTSPERVSMLLAYLEEHHPYETPAISAWPVAQATDPFINWIQQQTTAHPQPE